MTSRSMLPVGFVIVVGAVVLLGVSLGFAARGVSEGGSAASPSTTLAATTTTVARYLVGLECVTSGAVDPMPKPAYVAWTEATEAGSLAARLDPAEEATVQILESDLSNDTMMTRRKTKVEELSRQGQERGVLVLDDGSAQERFAWDVLPVHPLVIVVLGGDSPIPTNYPAATVFLKSDGADPSLSGSEESVVRLIEEGSGGCLPVPVP